MEKKLSKEELATLKFKSREKFMKKLKELDKVKASYSVDMVNMMIWDIEVEGGF